MPQNPETYKTILIVFQELGNFFNITWAIIKAWWWLPMPFLLWPRFAFYWLWWRQELWGKQQKFILLEIKIPREMLKPIRAMETVLTGFWQIFSGPNWYEKWWEGQYLLSFTLEIASVDGETHFYMRVPVKSRNIFEQHVYSQYPEAEIVEADDYTKYVPQDIPNKDWEMWGTDYKLMKEVAYPIRTYTDFETEREIEEEKRIDPMASLLEGMAKLQPGEQIWVQIRAQPIGQEFADPFLNKAKALKDKLARRPEKAQPKPMVTEAFDILVMGKVAEAEKPKEELIPPEMKLTPGEKEILAAVEKKMGKVLFNTTIRYIYLGKRDAFFGGNLRIAMSYFTNFISSNTNGPVPDGNYITKVKQNWYDWFWFFGRRLYLRKRKLFRNYKMRVWPGYPRWSSDPAKVGVFVLNAEELATVYHFPSKMVAAAPSVERVEAKRGEAPLGLPIE